MYCMFVVQPNVVRDKSYLFAVHVVEFCRSLQENKREYILSKQLLRSGTSVGANIEEAVQAQSKQDFISKLSIALKEAYESRYWIRLINDTRYADTDECEQLQRILQEVIALLVSILKKTKENLKNSQ